MPTFILNDENQVNSYGFRVKNFGISFGRFDANPVMLDSHINETDKVLGKWKNRKIEGTQLKADSEFDLAKDSAKVVAGQVDRGYLKGCSMGLGISFESDCWSLSPDGIYDLIKCELMEASVCAVPSNAASVSLISQSTGKPISDFDFKLRLAAVNPANILLNQNPTPGKTYHALTPDQFYRLSVSEQLDYKKNQNAAYLQTVSVLNMERKKQTSTAPTSLTFDHIKNADDFQRMSSGDQLNFKLKFPAQYAAVLNIKRPLTNNDYVGYQRLNTNIGTPSLTDYSHIRNIDDFEKMSNADKLNFKNTCNAQYKALFAR